MAEEYDIQAIMNALKEKEEMDPDKYDGCYELMRETIEAYEKLPDLSSLNYKDMNLVYLTTVGTWKQGIEAKKKMVDESHLFPDDKEYLIMLWDEIWEKADKGEYIHSTGNTVIGLFGTGFLSFQNRTTDTNVNEFIKMCVDILPMNDDDEMFNRAEKVLKSSFKGMRAASASMVLHCLKPFSFPILNSNSGNKNIFEILGVDLVKKGNIESYIDNCRRIKAFRDANFSCKNYRIFDMAARKVGDYITEEHQTGKFDSWEIISEDVARKTCDKSFFEHRSSRVPKDIHWFFDVEDLLQGDKQDIVLIYDDQEYDAYVTRESISAARTRLYWNATLAEKFSPYALDGLQHVLEFQRMGEQRYQVHFVELGEGIIVTDARDEDGYWPSPKEYPVNISKDNWRQFIEEIELPGHKGCMRVLACFLDIGGVASPKTLSDKYKGHPNVYTASLLNTGKRAIKYFDLQPCFDGKTQSFFPAIVLGRPGKGVNAGTYEYKMRPELLEALQEMDLSGIELLYDKNDDIEDDKGDETMNVVNFDHNIILYGPPGTGKTYNSVAYAVAICENRPVEDVMKERYAEVLRRYRDFQEATQIAFTTFHQSYGYEEFIEGIKPKLDEESEMLGYSIEDGVFKDFCRNASVINVQAKGGIKIKEHPRIWAMILGGPGMTSLKAECFEKNEIRIGWHEVEEGNWDDDEDLSWRAKQMLHAFVYEMEPGDIVFIEKDSQSVDAIGIIAGDYEYDESLGRYPRRRAVEWVAKNIDLDMVQYLPRSRKQLARFTVYSLDYLGTEMLTEILNKYIGDQEQSVEPIEKPHVFIIDEINRGNISKIFGELITLIEDTKRAGAPEAMEAVLPYSGETFSVPKNVYILGTMNTADRSIALMDTALRRRFKFKEMMPNPEVLNSLGVGTIAVGGGELKVAKMLDVINKRIEYLFDREHTIGHAYFTKLADDLSLETLAGIFEMNVIPLLQEYFYEDYEKIQFVLGDNAKEDEFKFVLDKPLEIKDIFNGNPDIDLPEKRYEIQHEAFMKLESYKKIGKDL